MNNCVRHCVNFYYITMSIFPLNQTVKFIRRVDNAKEITTLYLCHCVVLHFASVNVLF